MSLQATQAAGSNEKFAVENGVWTSGLGESQTKEESPSSGGDPYLERLLREPPNHGSLIAAMDHYLGHDPDLQSFAQDTYADAYKQVTTGMQRITMQALLLQRAPSLEQFRDQLVAYIQDLDTPLKPELPRRQPRTEAPIKVPTAFSLLKFLVAIFGGPRVAVSAKRPSPPLNAADLDAFIKSLGAGHILSPNLDTTGQLTRLLTVKKPAEVLGALREWTQIDLSCFEDLLAEDRQERKGFWARIRGIATRVPEPSSFKTALIELFPDPFELDLFTAVAFPRAYHRAVRCNKDRAEALVSWVWTGLVWDKLETYLPSETLSACKQQVIFRRELTKLGVWGSLMAAVAIISAKLEETRERLTELKEKHSNTFIGVVAATLLSGIALLYMCNPFHAKSSTAAAISSITSPSPGSLTPGGAAKLPTPAGSSSAEPSLSIQAAPGCSLDGFCREAAQVVPHNLRRVFGTPDGHLFVAGDSGTLLHFDGATWSNAAPPLADKPAPLVGLFGTSATDLWVAGHKSTLLHFGMSGWVPQPLPAPADLQALWGSGDSLWAVGQGGILLQHQPTGWTPIPLESESKASLVTLFGTGPRDLWAVGGAGTILHFDGTQWRSSHSGTQRPLYAVWGSGPSDIWAVGEYGTLVHFDGKAWQDLATGAPWFANALYGVWGRSESDVWAVGTKGLVLHYDGKRWQPLLSGVQSPLRDVWVSPRGDAWVVGNGGAILRRAAAG